MSWILLIYNIILQGIAVIALVVLIHLFQGYSLSFLKDFFVFVAGWCLFGFCTFFLQDIIMPVMALQKDLQLEMIIKYVMVFLLMPVSLAMIYALARSLLILVDERPARWFRGVYWSTGMAGMISTALAMEYFLRTGNYEYLEVFHVWGFMVHNQLAIFLTLGYVHARSRGIKEVRRRRITMGLTRCLLIADFMYYMVLVNSSKIVIATPFADIPAAYFSIGFLYYLVVFVPVIYLMRRVNRDFADYRKVRTPVADTRKRAQQFGLSPREVEIVTLVLEGRSNHGIEEELFISQRTVKNHLYNIYRKLRVKNRLELFRLFLDA